MKSIGLCVRYSNVKRWKLIALRHTAPVRFGTFLLEPILSSQPRRPVWVDTQDDTGVLKACCRLKCEEGSRRPKQSSKEDKC
jgi:hypothetical protein